MTSSVVSSATPFCQLVMKVERAVHRSRWVHGDEHSFFMYECIADDNFHLGDVVGITADHKLVRYINRRQAVEIVGAAMNDAAPGEIVKIHTTYASQKLEQLMFRRSVMNARSGAS